MQDESRSPSTAPTLHEAQSIGHDEKGEIVDYSKERELVVPVQSLEQGQGNEFPDGGLRAWLVVLGAAFNTFSTFGFVNAFGVFQSYYTNTSTLLQGVSPSQIAWIGSIQYALVFLPALLVGRLFDIGHYKSIQLASTILLLVATFLVAECREYWQFLLCQGFAIGIGSGGLFGATSAVVSHWFKKRRGMAMGVVAVGSSLGGTIIPIMARKLIDDVGFKWTMRIIGFLLLVTLGIAFLTLQRRLPPVAVSGGLFNVRAFKDARYTTFCLSSFTTFLGIYTVLTFIDVGATSYGIDPEFSFYLVAIANGGSAFGRFLGGLAADKIGPLNVMIPTTFFGAIMTYAWPFARTKGALVAVAFIYGFCIGSYVSLIANPVMEMGDVEDAGRRIGMSMTFTALGALVGPPISGAINSATQAYEPVGYYAGSVSLVGIALMALSRYLAVGWSWSKF